MVMAEKVSGATTPTWRRRPRLASSLSKAPKSSQLERCPIDAYGHALQRRAFRHEANFARIGDSGREAVLAQRAVQQRRSLALTGGDERRSGFGTFRSQCGRNFTEKLIGNPFERRDDRENELTRAKAAVNLVDCDV